MAQNHKLAETYVMVMSFASRVFSAEEAETVIILKQARLQ